MGSWRQKFLITAGSIAATLLTSFSSLAGSNTQASHACAELPRRPRIESTVEDHVRTQLSSQRYVIYAGDEENPRPVPKASLTDLAADLQASLRGKQARREPVDPEAIYLIFHAATAPSYDRSVITLPKRDLWCLVRRGDIVLLSDGSTHHLTRIFSVDRETGKVFLVDLWPDRFFMLAERNVRGYTAKLLEFSDPILEAIDPGKSMRKLVQIDKDEFLKVLIGFITLDSYDIVENIVNNNPELKNSADFLFSAGTRLLDPGHSMFIDSSIPLLKSSLGLYEKSKNREEIYNAANRLHLGLLLRYYLRKFNNDQASVDSTLKELTYLWERFGKDKLISLNRAIDDFRVGLMAGDTTDFGSSVMFLTRAIEAEPNYQEAFVYRAIAKLKLSDSAGAIQDATQALALNAQARQKLEEDKNRRDQRDWLGELRDQGREKHLDEMRSRALNVRGNRALILGNGDQAIQDAEALIKFEPDSSDGYMIRGLALLSRGEVSTARIMLQKALDLEHKPLVQEQLKQTLARIK